MRLLLLGATGPTGQQLLSQALEQGHEVTALVRDPQKFNGQGERVLVRTGSATDPRVVDGAVEGQDAVLSALGVTSPKALLGTDLISSSMQALVPAMTKHGVSRLIWLSALGVGQSRDHAPPMLRIGFRTLFRQVGKDKAAGEDYVRSSGLDWTLVYPPTLTNGPRTGTYRSGELLDVKGVPKISRADVAEFMLAQLNDATYSRKIAILSQ